jgi:hypothetical protein
VRKEVDHEQQPLYAFGLCWQCFAGGTQAAGDAGDRTPSYERIGWNVPRTSLEGSSLETPELELSHWSANHPAGKWGHLGFADLLCFEGGAIAECPISGQHFVGGEEKRHFGLLQSATKYEQPVTFIETFDPVLGY